MHLSTKSIITTLLFVVSSFAISQDNISGGKSGIEGAKIGAEGSTVETTIGKIEIISTRLRALEYQNRQRIDEVDHLSNLLKDKEEIIQEKSSLIEKQQRALEKEVQEIEEALRELRSLEESLENASADVETSTAFIKNQQAFLEKLEKKFDEDSKRALEEIKVKKDDIIAEISAYFPDFESQLNQLGQATEQDVERLENNVAQQLETFTDRVSKQIENMKGHVTKQVDELKGNVTKRVDELKGSVEKQVDTLNTSVDKRIDTANDSTQRQFDSLNQSVTDRIKAISNQSEELTKKVDDIKTLERLTTFVIVMLAFLAVFRPTAEYLSPKINKLFKRSSASSQSNKNDEKTQTERISKSIENFSTDPLLEDAKVSYKKNDFDAVIEITEQLIQSKNSQKSTKIEAHALELKVYFELKNWLLCIIKVDQVIADFSETELSKHLPLLLVTKAQCLQNTGDFEAAAETYDEALHHLSLHDDPILEPEAFCGSIESWHKSQNIKRTQWLINKFQAKYDENITPHNQRQLLKVKLIHAELKLKKNETREALQVLNEVAQRFEQNEDNIIRAYVVDASLMAADCYVIQEQVEKAIILLWRIVDNYIKKGNAKLESKLLSPIVKACALTSNEPERAQAVKNLTRVMSYYDSKNQEYSALAFLSSVIRELDVKALIEICNKSSKSNDVTKFEIKKALRMLPESTFKTEAHFAFFQYFTSHRNLQELEEDLNRLERG